MGRDASPVDLARGDVDAHGLRRHDEIAPVKARRTRISGVGYVLALGTLIRLALIPLTHGQDFVVWDKASRAVLNGVNFYAHHPHYPGGPFAYFPLWAYVEAPFQWLAQESGAPFQILGKLPILAGDLATAALISRELRDRGRNPVLGTALFFLNPLVVYNSAYYGRFDSVACALILLAARLVSKGSPRSGLALGLAIAAKTFPAFLLPGILRAAGRGRRQLLGLTTTVLVALSLPYLDSLHAMLRDIVLYDTDKRPQGLSWLPLVLSHGSAHTVTLAGQALLLAFAVGTVALAPVADIYRYSAALLMLFIVCSKLVLEQYLTWPLPLLAILTITGGRRVRVTSLGLVGMLTSVGMLANRYVHPWGVSPTPLVIVLAVGCLLGTIVLADPGDDGPRSQADAALHDSAVDDHGGRGHVPGLAGGQEHHHVGDL